MNLFDTIEKLITEHGSAAILRERILQLREEFGAVEKRFIESEAREKALQTQLTDARLEIQRLQKLQEEDAVFHAGVQFRRGRATGGKWLPFCPICGGLMRPLDPRFGIVCAKCKAHSPFKSTELEEIIASIPSVASGTEHASA